MNGDLVLRKLCGDLTANERVRLVGYLQATIDAVMVGECNQRHPLFPHTPVQASRIGIAIGKFETSKQPLDRAIAEP
jgi:hypothetical protein